MESILENLGAWLQTLPEVGRGVGVLRYVVPLLASLLVARCAVPRPPWRGGEGVCWGADGAAMCCSNIRRSHGRTRF